MTDKITHISDHKNKAKSIFSSTIEEKIKERLEEQRKFHSQMLSEGGQDSQRRVAMSWEALRIGLQANNCVLIPEFKFNMIDGPSIILNILPHETVFKEGPAQPPPVMRDGAADPGKEPGNGGDHVA